MKIEKKVDPEVVQVLRQITADRSRRIASKDRRIEALQEEIAKVEGQKATIADAEGDIVSYLLRPFGVARENLATLRINFQTSTLVWDDGAKETTLEEIAKLAAHEKAKAEKILDETGKALAEKSAEKKAAHAEKKLAEKPELAHAHAKNGN